MKTKTSRRRRQGGRFGDGNVVTVKTSVKTRGKSKNFTLGAREAVQGSGVYQLARTMLSLF